MNEVASLAIVGAALSGLVQVIKSTLNTSPLQTRAMVIGLSILAAGTYYMLAGTNLLEEALQILLYANGVYAFLIKPFTE